MSSGVSLKEPNILVAKDCGRLKNFSNSKSLLTLHLLFIKGSRSLENIATDLGFYKEETIKILDLLVRDKFIEKIEQKFQLTLASKKQIQFSLFSLNYLVHKTLKITCRTEGHTTTNVYQIKEVIGRGATSISFLAKQISTGREKTLKIFFPSVVTYEQLQSAIQKRSVIQGVPSIPDIDDFGEIEIKLPDNTTQTFICVVLEYIKNARTFSEFLKDQDTVDPKCINDFIERIGGALEKIENVGLIHGDLHEGNILVVPSASSGQKIVFWLIDFIGIPSAQSSNLNVLKDLEKFKDHLINASIIICEKFPGVPAKSLLGDKAFMILQKLRNGEYRNFKEMMKDYNAPRRSIPANYFQPPTPEPFEWLRVEWINQPEYLYKLFVAEKSRFTTIARFGNTWISGPRGCGKSHYLRILEFHPDVLVKAKKDSDLNSKLLELGYDFKQAFGILFPCRLGEFKVFLPEAIGEEKFSVQTQQFLKHVLILKIWNKTLNTIRMGLETKFDDGNAVLRTPDNILEFKSFLESKMGKIAFIDDEDPVKIFLHCLSVCSAQENLATSKWTQKNFYKNIKMLVEQDLNEFFGILSKAFPDFKNTRFYLLVDDASYGHIHFELQKILNSLIRSPQSYHCFKITCDKYMYTLETSDDRAIDPRHEVTYVDLGEVSIKTQQKTSINLSEYMAKVVDARLKVADYKYDIRKILGESQSVSCFLELLSKSRKAKKNGGQKGRACYGGWNIIWNISHGSIRTLLELIEHIFKTNNVTKDSDCISLIEQDEAVRRYSERQFRSLKMLPGEMNGEPLGESLSSVISAIGHMSRMYLEKYDTGDKNRWYETISVERLDRNRLSDDAIIILNDLVRFGLLVDEGITFSRAQFGLCERYDLNKIFTPAFRITYRVRNHIYLSHVKFSELLVRPDKFVAYHRKKIDALITPKKQKQIDFLES